MITLLMILLDQNRPLPQRRALIYKEFVDIFLDWDRLKGIETEFELSIKRRILTGLAFKLFSLKNLTLSNLDFENKIKEILESETVNLKLKEEIIRSEILYPNPPDGFSFLTQSIYEFLVARFFFDNREEEYLIKNYHDSRLEEIIELSRSVESV